MVFRAERVEESGESRKNREHRKKKLRECGSKMEEREREGDIRGKMKKVKQSVKRRRTRRRC